MLTRLLFTTLLLLGLNGLFAQPANDDCSNAIEVTLDEEVSFTTVGATDVGPNVAGCGGFTPAENDSIPADIWFTFTATEDVTVQWSNCDLAGFDSRMAIYAAAPCDASNDNLVTCNDDGPNCAESTSLAAFVVSAGQTYALRLGGFANEETPGTSGEGTVVLSVIDVPINDMCANAIPIMLGEEQAFTTDNALTDGPDHENSGVGSGCFGFNSPTVGQDVWYTFTPEFDATIQWTTCGMIDFDSRMAVYAPGAACPPEPGDLLFCNDDGSSVNCPSGQFHSDLFFEAEAGETYILRLGGFGSETGSGTFDLITNTPPPAPENDLCENAIEVTMLTEEQADDFDDLIVGTTIGAGSDLENYLFPYCLENQNGGEFADVWYSVQTLGNEEIQLRLFSSVGQGPNAPRNFFMDAFISCDERVDSTVVMESCVFTEEDVPDNAVNMSGLPPENITLLIRVTSRLTTTIPGDFGIQVVADIVSDVVDYSFAQRLSVFPNPTSEELNVRFQLKEAKTIEANVYDLLGRCVLTQRQGRLVSGEQQFSLNTSNLASGVYMLSLTDGTAQQQLKFIVR